MSPAVLVPADQSAGLPEDLLGEQDRSPGEGNGRGGWGDSFCSLKSVSRLRVGFLGNTRPLSPSPPSDHQHEGQVQGDAGALRQPGAPPQRHLQGEAGRGEEVSGGSLRCVLQEVQDRTLGETERAARFVIGHMSHVTWQ